jgi:hypothetical protein
MSGRSNLLSFAAKTPPQEEYRLGLNFAIVFAPGLSATLSPGINTIGPLSAASLYPST